MKLSTDHIPASKLHKTYPLKAGRFQQTLRRWVSRLSDSPASSSSQPASASSDAKAPSANGLIPNVTKKIDAARQSKGMKVFLHLLLVRPWVLVLGLWLLSLGGGWLALGGMLSPRRLTMALPEPVNETPGATAESPQVNVAETVTAGATDSIATADQADSNARLPVLPMLLIAGGCATGCLLVSRRMAMARMSAARAKSRTRSNPRRVRPARTKRAIAQPAANASAARSKVLRSDTHSERRSEKSAARRPAAKSTLRASGKPGRAKPRRQRTRQPLSAQTSNMRKKPVLTSRTTANKPMLADGAQLPSPRRSVRRRSARRGAQRRQPVVSVVPANVSHSLDWPEGSLAHELDVRHRSAM